jgi:hypothetical protein
LLRRRNRDAEHESFADGARDLHGRPSTWHGLPRSVSTRPTNGFA